MRFSELQGKAGKVGNYYSSFNYFACNAVIIIHAMSKSLCQKSSWVWGVTRGEQWQECQWFPWADFMGSCWGAAPVPGLLPQRAPWVVLLVVVLPPGETLPVPSVSPQRGHSVRESTEAALPGWANGKPAGKQVLWGLWTTGRQLGHAEIQILGESFLNSNTLLMVPQSTDLLCSTCLLEVNLF